MAERGPDRRAARRAALLPRRPWGVRLLVLLGGRAPDGKTVFTDAGCGGCHELADAGTTGGTGPNLDEGLKGKDPAFIEQSIVDPSANVTQGFSDGIMPGNFGQTLKPDELDALVKYLARVTK